MEENWTSYAELVQIIKYKDKESQHILDLIQNALNKNGFQVLSLSLAKYKDSLQKLIEVNLDPREVRKKEITILVNELMKANQAEQFSILFTKVPLE